EGRGRIRQSEGRQQLGDGGTAAHDEGTRRLDRSAAADAHCPRGADCARGKGHHQQLDRQGRLCEDVRHRPFGRRDRCGRGAGAEQRRRRAARDCSRRHCEESGCRRSVPGRQESDVRFSRRPGHEGKWRQGQPEAGKRAPQTRTAADMTKETGFGVARWDQTRFLVPLLAYCAAAAVTTWPLVLHPRALLGATSGPGDPYLNLWILGWDMQTLLSNPALLVNGTIFNANIFFPATSTLAYSDHLLLQSLLLAPLYAVTGDVVLCYNVLLLASLVGSALAMHVFVRSTVRTEAGAYLAGLAW